MPGASGAAAVGHADLQPATDAHGITVLESGNKRYPKGTVERLIAEAEVWKARQEAMEQDAEEERMQTKAAKSALLDAQRKHAEDQQTMQVHCVL